MKRFNVIYTEEQAKVIYVYAENEKDAEEMAEELYMDGTMDEIENVNYKYNIEVEEAE